MCVCFCNFRYFWMHGRKFETKPKHDKWARDWATQFIHSIHEIQSCQQSIYGNSLRSAFFSFFSCTSSQTWSSHKKRFFFSFILYANCFEFSYGELEQASILFSKKSITFDPFEMCCIIFPSLFPVHSSWKKKTRWNQFTSKNNDMTFCFEFVATFRMPLVGQYRLICLFMFLLTPATKWWSDGRLGSLSSGWVRMK